MKRVFFVSGLVLLSACGSPKPEGMIAGTMPAASDFPQAHGERKSDDISYIIPQGSTGHQKFLAFTRGRASGWTELQRVSVNLGFKTPQYPYYAKLDACSGATSDIARQRFDWACEIHDICYRIGTAGRGRCDEDFRVNMEKKCDNVAFYHKGKCYSEARLMYQAVAWNPRGQEIFSNRQSGQKKYEQKMMEHYSKLKK